MKPAFYRHLYKVLLLLSNYFDNRYLKKYKVLVGTSLLVITSACQSPKKDNSGEASCYLPAEYDGIVDTQSYDSPGIISRDTPAVIQVAPSFDSVETIGVMCYDVAIEPAPEIIPDVTCYVPIPDEPEVTCYEPMEPMDEDTAAVHMIVEQMPVFPGGDKELVNYLQEKIIYPKKALKDSIQGRVVVSFIVEKDGSLSSIEVVRGITASLDKEAIRIIRSMPAWTPGKQRDKIVRVKYVLPIRFRLPDKNTEK